MKMTKQPKLFARPAFRPAFVVLLLLCLFNAGVTANSTTQDVKNGSTGGEIRRAYRQNQTPDSALAIGQTRAQKRTTSALHLSQFNKSPTAASIFLSGGSIKQRRIHEQSPYTSNIQHEKASSSSLSSSWTRSDLAVFLSASSLIVLSSTLVAFSQAPALIAEIGMRRTATILATISSCSALTEIIISPAVGSLLDSIGRKPALVFALSCIACVHALVSIYPSVFTICAAKFIVTVCTGSFVTTTQVVVSDVSVSNPERMSSILGIMYALYGFAFIVGAIGAGKLSEFGLSVSYGTSTVVAALTAALVFFRMKETLQSSKRIPFGENKSQLKKKLLQSPWSSCTSILSRRSKEVRVLAILIMIQSLPSHMSDTFQILVRSEWNVDTKDFSSFIAMIGVIGIFSNIVGSQMVIKLGIKHFTAIATLSSVISPIGASIFSFRGLIIGIIVGFLGSAQMLGVTAALYVEGAKSNVPQGELAGERSSFLALAKVIGPIWYSFLYVNGKKVFGTGLLPFWFNIGCGLTAFGVSQRYLPS